MVEINLTQLVKKKLEEKGYTVQLWKKSLKMTKWKDKLVTLGFLMRDWDGNLTGKIKSENIIMAPELHIFHDYNQAVPIIVDFFYHGNDDEVQTEAKKIDRILDEGIVFKNEEGILKFRRTEKGGGKKRPTKEYGIWRSFKFFAWFDLLPGAKPPPKPESKPPKFEMGGKP